MGCVLLRVLSVLKLRCWVELMGILKTFMFNTKTTTELVLSERPRVKLCAAELNMSPFPSWRSLGLVSHVHILFEAGDVWGGREGSVRDFAWSVFTFGSWNTSLSDRKLKSKPSSETFCSSLICRQNAFHADQLLSNFTVFAQPKTLTVFSR